VETYRQLVNFLKKKYPHKHPVHVRRTKVPGKYVGLCEQKTDNSFLIRIDKNLPEYYAVEVLLHEFAHVISWGKDKNYHGNNWGIAYSKVYRAYIEEFQNIPS